MYRPLPVLLVLALVVIPTATWAQDLAKPAVAEPTLKISTPDGDVYIRLLEDSDGPVRIPLKDNTYSTALEIATEIRQEGVVRVVINSLTSDTSMEPVGIYELGLGERKKGGNAVDSLLDALTGTKGGVGKPVQLFELGRLGLEDWSLQLAGFVAPGKN
jgi:hypothetical protein